MIRRASPLTFVLLAGAASTAFAAHPLQTEDTGTQGAGNVEIENGFSRVRAAGTALTLYQPQVSVGLSTAVDAIVQPALEWQRAPQGRVSGWGDTNLDAKWRFWGVDPLSLAVRAGVQLPTSEHALGLARGRASEHGLIALTWDDTPTTAHANIGVTYVPRGAASTRQTTVQVSAAVMRQLDERLIVTMDGQFSQDPDPRRGAWPGSMLAGVIWTAKPGLDLDAGWQRSLAARPVARTWLAGVTYRFAL